MALNLIVEATLPLFQADLLGTDLSLTGEVAVFTYQNSVVAGSYLRDSNPVKLAALYDAFLSTLVGIISSPLGRRGWQLAVITNPAEVANGHSIAPDSECVLLWDERLRLEEALNHVVTNGSLVNVQTRNSTSRAVELRVRALLQQFAETHQIDISTDNKTLIKVGNLIHCPRLCNELFRTGCGIWDCIFYEDGALLGRKDAWPSVEEALSWCHGNGKVLPPLDFDTAAPPLPPTYDWPLKSIASDMERLGSSATDGVFDSFIYTPSLP
ncbi:hypothetical protein GQ53DRAFT_823555 [Thozetella sp. PMI_491]|nr:hypothetical protein GQ53DRAFT_823555 [Thozetella sp. PMI_491]